ncbi:TPA: hypothetical protein MW175_000202 [Acinetobacter baumannii]|nr:hypothetical protein [Acinetobacter baumannii]
MSIVLTVLVILAIFHFFYQNVVVKTNQQLLQDDLEYEKLLLEVYLKENQNKLVPIELEFVKELNENYGHLSEVIKDANVLDYILFVVNRDENSPKRKPKIDISLVRKELQEFQNSSLHVLVRAMFVNSFLFLLLLSPLLILFKFVGTILNKPILKLDNLNEFSEKHC